eukprot:scaffold32502_cov44-Attheya_sp.AAC.1
MTTVTQSKSGQHGLHQVTLLRIWRFVGKGNRIGRRILRYRFMMDTLILMIAAAAVPFFLLPLGRGSFARDHDSFLDLPTMVSIMVRGFEQECGVLCDRLLYTIACIIVPRFCSLSALA